MSNYCFTPKNQISKELAFELFKYIDDDLHWVKRAPSKRHLTTRVGSTSSQGYRGTRIKGKCYQVHNLIWNMHYGTIPEGYTVDHIDRNPLNNSIKNMRLATRHEQVKNQWKGAKSGHRGVHHNKAKGKSDWMVVLKIDGKVKYIGCRKTIPEAVALRDKYELNLEAKS